MAPSSIQNNTNKATSITNYCVKTTYYQQIQQPKSRLCYTIFLHRQELRKRKITFMPIATSKFQLTYELITKTIQTVPKCSRADLEIATRETIFQTNLLRQMEKCKASQQKQMSILYNQHKQKLKKAMARKTAATNFICQQHSNQQILCHNNNNNAIHLNCNKQKKVV